MGVRDILNVAFMMLEAERSIESLLIISPKLQTSNLNPSSRHF